MGSCPGGVRATVLRSCGEPAALRLDALFDAYLAASAGWASCQARSASAGADAAGAARAAAAAQAAAQAASRADHEGLEAALARPSGRPVVAYGLAVLGAAATVAGSILSASAGAQVPGAARTAGLGLVIGGTVSLGAGFVVAVADL